jgi:hypothetical protein
VTVRAGRLAEPAAQLFSRAPGSGCQSRRGDDRSWTSHLRLRYGAHPEHLLAEQPVRRDLLLNAAQGHVNWFAWKLNPAGTIKQTTDPTVLCAR